MPTHSQRKSAKRVLNWLEHGYLSLAREKPGEEPVIRARDSVYKMRMSFKDAGESDLWERQQTAYTEKVLGKLGLAPDALVQLRKDAIAKKSIETAFARLYSATPGERHYTMVRAARTILCNGNRESDWQRLYEYASALRGTPSEGIAEAESIRRWTEQNPDCEDTVTDAGYLNNYVASAAAQPTKPRQVLLKPLAEKPPHLRLKCGHWLVNPRVGSRTWLRDFPTDSPEYADAKKMTTGWDKNAFNRMEAMVEWGRDHAIAVIPASLQVFILDVDQDDNHLIGWLMNELSRELDWTPRIFCGRTRKGAHIMIPTSLMTGNSTFRIGDASGQVRSAKGYVMIHEPDYYPALVECMTAGLVPAEEVLNAINRLLQDHS